MASKVLHEDDQMWMQRHVILVRFSHFYFICSTFINNFNINILNLLKIYLDFIRADRDFFLESSFWGYVVITVLNVIVSVVVMD